MAPEWQTKTAPDQVFAGQLWILFASPLATFIFAVVLIPLSTLPSNQIFAEYITCNTCTLYQGKNSNPAELKQFKSNFNLLNHGGKKCPKQQQNVFFSVRWVLRDTTSLFLAFPSTLKIQSLRGCILPHSSRMFSLKDKAWIIYHHCNKLWNCLQL